MCIVVDANTWASVFKVGSADHQYYKPVRSWILNGKGQLVYGGTKYVKELGKAEQYLRFFKLLGDAKKAIIIDKILIDQEEKRLKKISPKAFNDQHLVAISIVSGCMLLCSNNTSDFPHIQNKKYYPKGKKFPKIYSASSFNKSAKILTDANIAGCCKPCKKTTNGQLAIIAQHPLAIN